MAPRIAKGKVIVGVSGGDRPTRGFFAAYDAMTGRQAWRFYTVPGDPAKGFENSSMRKAAATWDSDWWKQGGGGAVWDGIAYDPEAGLVYAGTGNAEPWAESLRQSERAKTILYVCSIVAVSVETGELKWHYQMVPGDSWDFDSVQQMILADLNYQRKPRKVIMQANKDGFYYVLDRVTGEFISAQPFSKVTWAKGIDQKTGRPIVNPEAHYGADPIPISPGGGGAHNWSPMSFNPNTGLMYIPTSTNNSFTYAAEAKFDPKPGRHYGHGPSGSQADARCPARDRSGADRGHRAEGRAGRMGSGGATHGLAHAGRRRNRRRHGDHRGKSCFSDNQRRTPPCLQRRQGREAAGDPDRFAQRHGPADHMAGGRQTVCVADGRGRDVAAGNNAGPGNVATPNSPKLLTFVLDGTASSILRAERDRSLGVSRIIRASCAPPLFVVILLVGTVVLFTQDSGAGVRKGRRDFVYTTLSFSPVTASGQGLHKYNGKDFDRDLDDLSRRAIQKQRDYYIDLHKRLEAFDKDSLSPEDRADYDIIDTQIGLALFDIDIAQSWQHSPQSYVELLGSALFNPFVLEYAPKPERYEHIIARLQKIPEFIDVAQRQLAQAPPIWAQVAKEENDGNIDLIDKTLREGAPADQKKAYDTGGRAGARFSARLQQVSGERICRRRASGATPDWRLGAEHYATKFKLNLATDRTPDEVLKDAETRLKEVRARMLELSLPLHATMFPGHGDHADLKGDERLNKIVREVLDGIAEKHSTPASYMDDARKDLDEARDFARAKNLLTLPAARQSAGDSDAGIRARHLRGGRLQSGACARTAARRVFLDHADSRRTGRRLASNRSCANTTSTT